MKKMLMLIAAVVFIFTACDKSADVTQDTQDDTVNAHQEEDTSDEAEAVTENPTEKPTMEPTEEPVPLSNLVAVVVARDRYAEPEFTPVMEALADAGYDTVIVSDELGTADGTVETTEVEKTFTDLSSEDLRGIVLIGGSDSLWENTELHALLADCRDNGRVTAAICLASVTLAKAEIIGEGDSACWFNCDIADPEMEAAGVSDTGQPVTVDGLIITGDGPSSAEEFAQEIVTALDGL